MSCNRILTFSLALITLFACVPQDRYVVFSGYAQGGTYAVKINLKGEEGMIRVSTEEIRDSVAAILDRIDRSLSGYNKGSLLSRFNEGERIVPDNLFLDIYEKAYYLYDETGGMLDVASGPLYDLWGFGFKSGKLPDVDEVKDALSISGMNRLIKDVRGALDADGSLSGENLLKEGETGSVRLNYNAIAQGYSCDVVARYLYSIGVKDMMVDIGEIFCDGKNPSGKPWTIGIDRPVDGNNSPGADVQTIFRVPEGPHGVVTSGNYRKFHIKDGKKYAHTIDPRNGNPVMHNLLSATIVAPNALDADAYATYCMAIGLEESIAFLDSRSDLEGCLIYDNEGEFCVWCSSGFRVD